MDKKNSPLFLADSARNFPTSSGLPFAHRFRCVDSCGQPARRIFPIFLQCQSLGRLIKHPPDMGVAFSSISGTSEQVLHRASQLSTVLGQLSTVFVEKGALVINLI